MIFSRSLLVSLLVSSSLSTFQDLCESVKTGDVLRFQALFPQTEFNATEACDDENEGKSLIVLACEQKAGNSSIEILKSLLSHNGTDVNEKTVNGSFPLFAASTVGNLEAVEVLLSHPAIDVDNVDKEGATALYAAALNGHLKIVKVILEHTSNASLDWTLVEEGHSDSSNSTICKIPLHAASMNGHYDVVRALLNSSEYSAHLDRADCFGLRAIDLAMERQHFAVVQLLMQHGAKMNFSESHLIDLLVQRDAAIRSLLTHSTPPQLMISMDTLPDLVSALPDAENAYKCGNESNEDDRIKEHDTKYDVFVLIGFVGAFLVAILLMVQFWKLNRQPGQRASPSSSSSLKI